MSKAVGLVIGILAIITGVFGIWYVFLKPSTQPDQIMVPPTEPTITEVSPTSAPITLTSAIWMANDIFTTPPLDTATPTAQFSEDGNLSGSDGCNSYSTTYTAEGNQLTINPTFAITRRACSPKIEAQATSFITYLQSVTQYNIVGEALNLSSATDVVLQFTAQSQALTGNWEVTMYNTGTQAVTGVIVGTTITANFAEDGTLSGSGGCNTYSSTYTAQDSSITITPPITTMMFCEEPAGVSEQETAFLTALPTANTYQVTGDTLELRTTDGALVASMMRAAPTP